MKISTTKELLTNIRSTIFPVEAELKRIEFEGPEIALYCGNPSAIMSNSEAVKRLAKLLKKRVVIRSDPEARLNRDDTIKMLRELIPSEADVRNYTFNDDKGEVIVEALRPGVVIGEGGSLLREVWPKLGGDLWLSEFQK